MKRAKRQASLAITLLVSFVMIFSALALPPAGEASRAYAPSSVAPVAAQSGDLIPDQYVVVFKDDFTGDVVAAANELVNANGGTLLHVYQYALKGFSATFKGGNVDLLASDSRVASIEQDRVISISGSRKQTPSAVVGAGSH